MTSLYKIPGEFLFRLKSSLALTKAKVSSPISLFNLSKVCDSEPVSCTMVHITKKGVIKTIAALSTYNSRARVSKVVADHDDLLTN